MTNQFIEDCRYLGRSLGKPDAQEERRQHIACQLDPHSKMQFVRTDDFLLGVGVTDLSLVLIRLENNNPVAVFGPDGHVIRWHGEAKRLLPHINSAVSHLGKFGREAFAV